LDEYKQKLENIPGMRALLDKNRSGKMKDGELIYGLRALRGLVGAGYTLEKVIELLGKTKIMFRVFYLNFLLVGHSPANLVEFYSKSFWEKVVFGVILWMATIAYMWYLTDSNR